MSTENKSSRKRAILCCVCYTDLYQVAGEFKRDKILFPVYKMKKSDDTRYIIEDFDKNSSNIESESYVNIRWCSCMSHTNCYLTDLQKQTMKIIASEPEEERPIKPKITCCNKNCHKKNAYRFYKDIEVVNYAHNVFEVVGASSNVDGKTAGKPFLIIFSF